MTKTMSYLNKEEITKKITELWENIDGTDYSLLGEVVGLNYVKRFSLGVMKYILALDWKEATKFFIAARVLDSKIFELVWNSGCLEIAYMKFKEDFFVLMLSDEISMLCTLEEIKQNKYEIEYLMESYNHLEKENDQKE